MREVTDESLDIDRLLNLMNRARTLRNQAATAGLRAWAVNSLSVLYAAAGMIDRSSHTAPPAPFQHTVDVILQLEEEFLDRLDELVFAHGGMTVPPVREHLRPRTLA